MGGSAASLFVTSSTFSAQFTSSSPKPREITKSQQWIFLLRIWLFRLSIRRDIKSFSNFRLQSKHKVIQIGPGVVMKGGPWVRHVEAQAMAFVRENTRIPVPRPYETLLDTEGLTYIVMEAIDAPELESVWHKLTEDERKSAVRQLCEFLRELRELKPPENGMIAAVDQGPLQDVRCDSVPFGPFSSFDDFAYKMSYPILTIKDERAQALYSKVANREHPLVFTHCDLAPRNILYKDGSIKAIVDWESAGWYPDYWEYTRTRLSNLQLMPFWEIFRELFPEKYEVEVDMELEVSGYIFTL